MTTKMSAPLTRHDDAPNSLGKKIFILASVAALVYALILSVGMVGTGFKWAAGGADKAKEIFSFATNPFVGLILAVLATAIVQSSSTVTSVIVGLVAGGLPVQTAIPMIMGANIGTTVTALLVSMGHIGRPQEFRRAFAAGCVHDQFNLLAVIIFLTIEVTVGCFTGKDVAVYTNEDGKTITFNPENNTIITSESNNKTINFFTKSGKEVSFSINDDKVNPSSEINEITSYSISDKKTNDTSTKKVNISQPIFTPDSTRGPGFLEMVTEPVAAKLAGDGSKGFNVKSLNFIKPMTKPIIKLFHNKKKKSGIFDLFDNNLWGGIAMIITALGMIFGSIFFLGKMLKKNLTGKAEKIFHAAIGKNAITGIASGTIITVLVQSSSTTTSLVVPMAGAGIFSLKQVFPFTIGANIGTTITALLASLAGADSPELAQCALQIALVHTLFNVSAAVLIYGTPFLRKIPLATANWLADLTLKSRAIAVVYVLTVFFVIPGSVIGIMKLTEDKSIELQIESKEAAPSKTTPTEKKGDK